MHTHTHKPPAPKHTPNIWKAERLVGQISVSKSKRSLRTQKGSDANASSETRAGKHASLAFLGCFFFHVQLEKWAFSLVHNNKLGFQKLATIETSIMLTTEAKLCNVNLTCFHLLSRWNDKR